MDKRGKEVYKDADVSRNSRNSNTELCIVNLLSILFDNVAIMDPRSVQYNIELGCAGAWTQADRSMRVELGNYIINHFSLIYLGLITNDLFRDTFVEAVAAEIALDDENKATVADIRKEMVYNAKSKPSKGNYVLNFSAYNEAFYQKLSGKLLESFQKTSEYDDAIEEIARSLSDDNMIALGFIMSNFAYLFRAFAQNGKFTHYVKTVVHTVEIQLGLDSKAS